jgi:hypothetical protein
MRRPGQLLSSGQSPSSDQCTYRKSFGEAVTQAGEGSPAGCCSAQESVPASVCRFGDTSKEGTPIYPIDEPRGRDRRAQRSKAHRRAGEWAFVPALGCREVPRITGVLSTPITRPSSSLGRY